MPKTPRKTQHAKLLDDVFLQPWFLPLSTAVAVKRLLPPLFLHKMRSYYEDYGCLKCGARSTPHCANALCKICNQQVKLKFLLCLKRREMSIPQPGQPPFNRVADARRLLG